MKMIKQMSCWINNRYSTPLMLALFFLVAVFFWVFNLSTLSISSAEFIKICGHDGKLDVKLFYTAKEAYAAITNFGPEGRNLYIKFLTVDFIFLITYSFAFSFLITLTVRAVCSINNNRWLMLNVLPLAIGIFDFIENICILGMLKIYPTNNIIFGTLAGIATPCKWVLTLITISCLVYGGIILLARRFGFKHCTASGNDNYWPTQNNP